MKSATRKPLQRKQRGGAAVEMAVILPIMVVFLAIPLFLGRCFWHYSVAQKAAHDAARYLASVPLAQMRTSAGGQEAKDVAEYIATTETAELTPGGPYGVDIQVICRPGCTLGAPTTVEVVVGMKMFDPFFDNFTWVYTGDDGLLLNADVTMLYVGS